MNIAHMTGNLTADVETRKIGEQTLSKLTVACNQGDQTLFLPVEVWNQGHIGDYLGKGSRVLISGALKQESWKNSAGDRRSRIVLVGSSVEFLDPRPEGSKAKQATAVH